jgi:hypothetical protein
MKYLEFFRRPQAQKGPRKAISRTRYEKSQNHTQKRSTPEQLTSEQPQESDCLVTSFLGDNVGWSEPTFHTSDSTRVEFSTVQDFSVALAGSEMSVIDKGDVRYCTFPFGNYIHDFDLPLAATCDPLISNSEIYFPYGWDWAY